MGSWIGHIAPGVFFVLFALWWHINNCMRYMRAFANGEMIGKATQQQVRFRGSTTYPCGYLPSKTLRQLPIESIIKILITSIHFSIELITGYHREPTPHIGDENAHHTAMLFGFFLGSWVEILVHYKFLLPKRITQVMGFLAFGIEGLTMIFHLHARSMVDAHIHQLLGLTIICSMIGALCECFDPNNFWFIIARSFFALTQGTWFLQAAYVIWPKTTNPLFIWDPQSHRSVSLLTMSYAYHLAGNAVILIIVYFLVYMSMRSHVQLNNDEIDDDDDDRIADYKLIKNVNDEENFA
ncbi:unnamed protein product [Rotaria sp. Silwood1]|nr:unnamed protein product [Rotaria sp. Silwood1]CAF1051863.1 unnamed protein product [Rotaria sp. Silwood1]CAF1157192.1 unnamed protein product [Rotaria sp. Silwood1]CAF3426160.1 unnamed protein product [Rotaria sp. Silwood1]CAF3434778.1 unnamed protein product [Rotaria sp. Silwood1]